MAFISKTDIKLEIQIDGTMGTTYDTFITSLATRILSLWDDLTHRTWASTEHTEYYSTPEHTNAICLNNYPITAISEVYDDPDWDYGSDTAISSDDYTYDATNGIFFYNGYFYSGNNNIKIVYTAGYTDDNVPGWLKQILIRQCAHWYEQAKNKRWDMSSKALPNQGGTINYSTLKDNLLPDFVKLVEMHRLKC